MPRGFDRGRGHKSGHKGQRRHFTSPEELEANKEREERERQWREQQGDESTGDEDDDDKSKKSGSEAESDNEAGEKKKAPAVAAAVVEGSLEVENPNRVVNKTKKVTELDLTSEAKPELSRREREELERQQARVNYQKLHAAGKTEEARADLARLAIIKKQREDAAKKRDEERKAKEAVKAAKTDSLNKALGKGKKT